MEIKRGSLSPKRIQRVAKRIMKDSDIIDKAYKPSIANMWLKGNLDRMKKLLVANKIKLKSNTSRYLKHLSQHSKLRWSKN